MSSIHRFKIVTYNIEYGSQHEKIFENIIQMVKDGVDVFCLQEVINIKNETFFIDTLLNKLGSSWGAAYNIGKEDGRLSLGNALLWNKKKFSIISNEKILLPLS